MMFNIETYKNLFYLFVDYWTEEIIKRVKFLASVGKVTKIKKMYLKEGNGTFARPDHVFAAAPIMHLADYVEIKDITFSFHYKCEWKDFADKLEGDLEEFVYGGSGQIKLYDDYGYEDAFAKVIGRAKKVTLLDVDIEDMEKTISCLKPYLQEEGGRCEHLKVIKGYSLSKNKLEEIAAFGEDIGWKVETQRSPEELVKITKKGRANTPKWRPKLRI